MCLGGGGTNYPDLGPRDTSNELIVSKYELSEENKAKNLKRAKSLVKFDNNDNGGGDGNNGLGAGTSVGGSSSSGSYGGFQDASGGFQT